jgi:hypothetical protein
MKNILIGLLAISTVVLAVLYARERKERQVQYTQKIRVEEARAVEAEARLADASRVNELERVNARLDKQVQQFTALTAALRTNEAAQASNAVVFAQRLRSAQKSGSAGSGTNGGILNKGMGEMLGQMMKDPNMRDMLREQQKVTINMMYNALFKDLKVSPEVKDKLRELLTDTQMRNVESAGAMLSGDKEQAAEATAKINEARKASDEQIKTLLGEDGFAEYQDYQKNIGERMQLDQLKTRMAADNTPLRDDQFSQLLQVMQDEKTAHPPAIPSDGIQMPDKSTMSPENVEKQLAWMEEYNKRVYDRAAQILSPDQLKAYKAFQEQQASFQKIGLKMAGQMFGGGAGKE